MESLTTAKVIIDYLLRFIPHNPTFQFSYIIRAECYLYFTDTNVTTNNISAVKLRKCGTNILQHS